MSMTIKVYAVRRDGTTRVIREKRVIPVDEEPLPPVGTAFPPCACPVCRRVREVGAR
ncbi:hypothetical protein [Streptomyces sp. CC228A]|uniref:hypothetical protein n=1 Tax=Streptomyces sp. CC228A TaxID=2898186 RepID=UPI001F2F5076|nr:hypothetical protein [Streptomyces sp. CC228A]